jgi:hypothetical protein
MLGRFRVVIIVAAAGFIFHVEAAAQSADGRSPILAPRQGEDDDRPRGFKETLERLRIDKEKKEFDEMIGRGEEAARISEELEKAYARNGRLENDELTKVAAVEKLVKKIRSELGGDGDEGENEDKPIVSPAPVNERGEMVKTLRSTTLKLLDELKKTTRFTVSAAAIQTSNAVLKLARFLRIAR